MKKKYTAGIFEVSALLFFLAYLFHFVRMVDSSLIHYWHQSIALPIVEALSYPGGFSEMLGDKVIEFFIYPTSGGIAILFLCILFASTLLVIFRKYFSNHVFIPLLLGALIPFSLLFSFYRLSPGLIICILSGFFLSAVYSLYQPGTLLLKAAYILLAGILVYMLAGSVGLVIFLQVSIIEGIRKRKYLEAGLCIVLLIIPLLYLPFNLIYTVKTVYFGVFIPSSYDMVPSIFYIILAIPIILYGLYSGLDYTFGKIRVRRPLLIKLPLTVLFFCLLFLFSGKSINELEKKILSVELAGLNKEWQNVLDQSKEFNNTGINKLVQFEVNRALYHTGQLLNNLFWYPQPFGEQGIFLETGNFSSRGSFHMCDLYQDMAFAAETRHWATEAQMYLKRNPVILKHLVLSYLAEDKIEAALKYLKILSESRLYRDWCEEINDLVSRNALQENPVIASLIKNNPKIDFFDSASTPVKELTKFYLNNPDNNVAFEFLMASHLLRHGISDVLTHISDFRNFGYTSLPRNIEEAVLIYIANNPDRSAKLAGYSISDKTMADFTDFNKLVLSSKSRNEARRLVHEYRNTYWYYVLFSSPYATKNK